MADPQEEIMDHTIVHFEIPFDDKKRAMTFYSDVFGWKLTDMAEMSYVMAETVAIDDKQTPKEPGAINGGLFQRPKEAPHPVIYAGVESVDQALKKVRVLVAEETSKMATGFGLPPGMNLPGIQ